jgi:L-ascorbate 6-phosphate lactonase
MQRTHQILEDLRAHDSGTALWWLGNAGWAIKSDRITLLTDPVIMPHAPDETECSEIGLPLVHELPLQADMLGPADVDLCLVTHAHGDHLAPRTIPVLHECTTCRFVVPLSCMARMRELGVAEERMIPALHGQPIVHGHVTIEPVKALHGHEHGSVYREANFQDCGYLIRDGRWTIFHPGDSVLLHEHLEMAPPDVFLVSITEHNLWVRNAALLANLWRPPYTVPMHYDTYARNIFWTIGDPQALLPHLAPEARAGYTILPQGVKLALAEGGDVSYNAPSS